MKQLLSTLVFFALLHVVAQEKDPIVTDRPTQSAAVNTVGRGNLLVESGFIFENSTETVDFINVNSLFRFGISDKVELRLTANYDREEGLDFISSGIGVTSLGTKVFLFSSDNAFADISVLGQLNIPTGDNNDETTGEVRFNFQNQLSDLFALGYNLGVLASQEREYGLSPFYSIALSATLAEGWTAFIEPYGFFNAPADHRFNAGLVYLVTPRFQVDLTGGFGLTEESPDSFIGFGAAIGF